MEIWGGTQVQSSGFRVPSSEFKVQGSEVRRFWVLGSEVQRLEVEKRWKNQIRLKGESVRFIHSYNS